MLRRRSGAVLVVFLAVAAAAMAVLPSAHATPTVTTKRYGGADRYGTAMVLAEHAFPSGSSTAVLARAQNFPDGALGFADALAGNYLAGLLNGPILLTGQDSVPASTLQALQALKVKDVLVLGGTSAVSNAVLTQLDATPSAAGGNIIAARLGGTTRYQTAAMAAAGAGAAAVGRINQLPTALVARGDQFPDALAGGPLAFAGHFPLVLTETDSLDPAAAQALKALGIKAAIILGGTSAISTATEQAIQALGISTERLGGANRKATAAKVADYAILFLGFKDTLVDLARGDDYPDALAGGPEAARAGPVPIVLTGSPNDLSTDTAAWLKSVNGTLSEIDALGLQAAITDAVLAQAASDATCSAGVVPTTLPVTLPGGLTLPMITLPGALGGTCNPPITGTAAGGPTTTAAGGITIPTLPITLPTLPITLPTLPITLPTLPLGL